MEEEEEGEKGKKNGIAIIGFNFSILLIILFLIAQLFPSYSFIFILPLFAFVPLAIILNIIGLIICKTKKIKGTILPILGIAIALFLLIFLLFFVSVPH